MDCMKKRSLKSLVWACVAVVLLTAGCADKYSQILKTTNDRSEISATHSEFSSLANKSDMPIRYVSEGKIGVSKVEAALETADAIDLLDHHV